jgi:hypothetical protein
MGDVKTSEEVQKQPTPIGKGASAIPYMLRWFPVQYTEQDLLG